VHHEPPEVAWLLPELEEGAEPELKPLELFELFELFELPESPGLIELPELSELLEPLELSARPELLELLDLLEAPELPELCVDPGRARATAPAVTTLAIPTAVVADRTLVRPRSLACAARRILSRFMPSSWVRVLEGSCAPLLSAL
jgi:hypothetical protein